MKCQLAVVLALSSVALGQSPISDEYRAAVADALQAMRVAIIHMDSVSVIHAEDSVKQADKLAQSDLERQVQQVLDHTNNRVEHDVNRHAMGLADHFGFWAIDRSSLVWNSCRKIEKMVKPLDMKCGRYH